MICLSEYRSPCGVLVLGAYGDKLCLCDWQSNVDRASKVMRRLSRELSEEMCWCSTDVIDSAVRWLDAYFSGARPDFRLPLLITGTRFQRRVRLQLLQIAPGQTVSYADVAALIGRPRAVRAVASAVAANPLLIFVPCHRVIGSEGRLGRYAAGASVKSFLLGLENHESSLEGIKKG